jgi:hypothetical protein
MKKQSLTIARAALSAALLVAAPAVSPAQTPSTPPAGKPGANPQAPPAGQPGAKGVPQASAAAKKAGPAQTRFRIVLNGAAAFGGSSFTDVRTPTAYAETSRISTSYETGTGFGFDGAIQVSLYRGLGVLVGYTAASRDVTGNVDVSRPHPLYLNRPRSASAELSGYDYSESSADFALAYARTQGKLDWTIFAGVSLITVEADLLDAPGFDERYPYDELVISSTAGTGTDGDATGFNVGGRLDYKFSRSVGAGVQLRYSGATVGLKSSADAPQVDVDAGGFSVGAGIRFYF